MGHNVGPSPHLVTTKLLGADTYAYAAAGIALPRTARQQFDAVRHVTVPDVVSRVSRHHSPRSEEGPAHQPGHDDAHGHGGRFWQQRG